MATQMSLSPIFWKEVGADVRGLNNFKVWKCYWFKSLKTWLNCAHHPWPFTLITTDLFLVSFFSLAFNLETCRSVSWWQTLWRTIIYCTVLLLKYSQAVSLSWYGWAVGGFIKRANLCSEIHLDVASSIQNKLYCC